MSASSFFITTPIYYVNARPHLGHAYTTIIADALTRFERLCGKETWFLTGTDEHGDKIVQAAEAAGMAPQAFVDSVSGQFQALWPHLKVENNQFIRTTDPDHKAAVQQFLQRVHDAGDIYFGEFGGHYCTGCERFYTEKELENGLCPQHQTEPKFIQERNYFFRMSKYLPWLADHIRANPDFIRPERYRNEVLAMLEGGVLEDLCISRPKTRLEWGIELPFDKDYVCYVWFDALLNYISALDWPAGDKYARFWPGNHLVAKDILKPHGVFWPTMLKAAGLPLFEHLNVHGYWLVKDTKMSKSLGNVVEPLDMIGIYGLDAFRYFLMRDMQFGSDASFSEEALVARLNADLANDLGNLFSRTLSMNAKYCASRVPALGELSEDDKVLMQLAEEAQRNFVTLFHNVRFAQALESLWELVRALNKYVDTQAPWSLAKNGQTERLQTVLRVILECLRKVAGFLWPVMPGTSETMLSQLGVALAPATDGKSATPAMRLDLEAEQWGLLVTGTEIAPASNLFPRVDTKKDAPAKAEKAPKAPKASGAVQAASQAASQTAASAPAAATCPGVCAEAKPCIAFDDFQKLDLRVGTVLSCERVPKADKLLRFMIDLGEVEPRQILSGIAEHFEPDTLVGRQVCVVVNLAPRTIRGLVSQGMILSASSEGALRLIMPGADVVPGSSIS